MNFVFSRKRIAGILVALPANERRFVDDMRRFDFPESRSLKLMEVMGYDRHRVVTEGTCVSDLAVIALERLFDRKLVDREAVDALIVVTQSPDHFMPPTSNIIQGRLKLKHDMLCLDIPQGCAGYLIGLIQAFLILQQPHLKNVLVVNADVLSRKVAVTDRNSYPLIGDGLAVTLVENNAGPDVIYANVKMEGSASDALIIPAGGFRQPCSAETAVVRDAGDGNSRSLNDLRMDGTAVFNFVQREVPPMIDDLLRFANSSKDQVDFFLFHQPNKFMLQKLANKMGVPHEKMPMNVVENFGNSSGVTVPTAIAFNLGERLVRESRNVCLAGFGVGLTWSSMLLQLGPLDFCEMIDVL
ncbi:MAG: ketoacyl-ACP synthase III [Planctomycetia bacterium]|nr:ketoacyl-ACP synthase III [Planctomycetia bacterium]